MPMSVAASLRQMLPLAIGLVIGGVGASLFIGSMPGEEGSPEEKARRLEVELANTKKRLSAMENIHGQRRGSLRTVRDGARDIVEDLKEGRPVSPDDIFRTMQPWMRDLAPLFDRLRIREQKQQADAIAGELARQYHLDPSRTEALRKWFEAKAESDAKQWSQLVTKEGVTLQEIMRAATDARPDDGLDPFMEQLLSGDQLANFKNNRMAQRTDRVQQEADMKMQRLDSVVGLDDAQRDQVFGIMARGSRDYDPAMKLEGGVGEIGTTPSGDPRQAVLSILRPDQRAAYESEQNRRREEARQDMEAIGLTLPEDWDLMEQHGLD